MTGGWKVGWGGPECSRPHLTDVPWHRGPVLCRGCGAKLNVGPVRQGAAFPLGRLDPALRAAAGSGGCDGGVKPCPAPRWCVSRARESAVFLLPGSFIAIRFTLRAIRPLKVPFAGSPHIPHCAAGTTTNVDRFRRRTRDAVPSSTQTRAPFPYAPLPCSVSPASLRDGRRGCGHAARSILRLTPRVSECLRGWSRPQHVPTLRSDFSPRVGGCLITCGFFSSLFLDAFPSSESQNSSPG